jgi:ferritin-like metal-binding protein YciE
MKIEKLSDLFVHTLQDIYYAEKHIVKALPKMIKASDSSELSKAFTDHLAQTEEHVTRLEQVFEMVDQKAKAAKCPAIDGILEEAKELMGEIKDPDTRDAAMIAAAQAVEHYEITRYGTLVSWANLLGLDDAAKVLEKTLKEEHAADSKLTKIAENHLNAEAVA